MHFFQFKDESIKLICMYLGHKEEEGESGRCTEDDTRGPAFAVAGSSQHSEVQACKGLQRFIKHLIDS